MTLVKSLLHRMQRTTVLSQAFDRRQVVAFGLDRQHQARPHRRAVKQHGAAAANAMLAADVRPCEPEIVTQVVGKQTASLAWRRVRDAVDLHCAKALSVRTLTRWTRNSGEASRSPLG